MDEIISSSLQHKSVQQISVDAGIIKNVYESNLILKIFELHTETLSKKEWGAFSLWLIAELHSIIHVYNHSLLHTFGECNASYT